MISYIPAKRMPLNHHPSIVLSAFSPSLVSFLYNDAIHSYTERIVSCICDAISTRST